MLGTLPYPTPTPTPTLTTSPTTPPHTTKPHPIAHNPTPYTYPILPYPTPANPTPPHTTQPLLYSCPAIHRLAPPLPTIFYQTAVYVGLFISVPVVLLSISVSESGLVLSFRSVSFRSVKVKAIGTHRINSVKSVDRCQNYLNFTIVDLTNVEL